MVYVPNVLSFPSLFTYPHLPFPSPHSVCIWFSLLSRLSDIFMPLPFFWHTFSHPVCFSSLFPTVFPPPQTLLFLSYSLFLTFNPTHLLFDLSSHLLLLLLSLSVSTLCKYNPIFHGKVTLLFPSFEPFF